MHLLLFIYLLGAYLMCDISSNSTSKYMGVPNFLKGVPKVPKSISGWRMTSNHCLRSPKEQMDHGKEDEALDRSRIRCTKFF